jgi:uncharacterized membrane protein YeiH
MMNNIKTWLSGLLKDEKGTPSSKRFVGILCALTLCITMYSNSFTEAHFSPSKDLVDAVALLAFACLGLSSVDKIWGKKTTEE